MKKIVLAIIFLSLLDSFDIFAQQQDLWTTFTTDDGLAGNEVHSILESSDGALWFGTEQGVSRYQEGIWTTYTTANGLAYDYVSSLCEARDGSLWFGTLGAGVSQYKDGIWTNFSIFDGLAGILVYSTIESSDGTLWFGTYAGVSFYKDGIWNTYNTTDGLAGNYVYSICEASDGALWFGTSLGVSRYAGGEWTNYTTVDGLVHDNVNAILESSSGTLWFGTEGGVSNYDGETWTTFTTAEGLADDRVHSILESSEGTLWFGTDGGISSYDGEMWTNYTTDDGLAGNEVYSILESSHGALWFGTNLGINRYEGLIWTTFTNIDGLDNYIICSIIEASDGALWFAALGGGAYRFKDGTWIVLTTDDGLMDNRVRGVFESSDGAFWFSTDAGLCRYEGGIWTTFTQSDGLVEDRVYAIFESSDGALWVGHYHKGVSRYMDGIWTTFIDELAGSETVPIIESRDGALWFATSGGVSHYEAGEWTTITTADGLIDNVIMWILESSDGALWFATRRGVSRYEAGGFTHYTTADGLVDNMIWCMIESSNGALWFATDNGVSRFQAGTWATFSTVDGLAGNKIHRVFEASDGTLWFGTADIQDDTGICRLKPDKLPPSTLIIEGPDSEIIGIPTPLFVFKGYDYRTKIEELLFSYAVVETTFVPNINDWTPFDGPTTIQTRPLQNGTYRFHVRSIDKWGNIDPTPATRTFTVDITSPTTVIESPRLNDVVDQQFPIIGSAFDDSPIKDFDYYSVLYGKGSDPGIVAEWDTLVYQQTREVRSDTLVIWDAHGLRGAYQLRLFARDTLGHESDDIITIHIVDAIEEVTSNQGGYVSDIESNIQVYFPPNSLDGNTSIQIERVSDTELGDLEEDEYKYAGMAFDILPKDLRPKKPGTLTLSCHDSLLNDVNDEKKLAIYQFDETEGSWALRGGSVDVGNNTVSTSITQLGRYGLFKSFREGTSSSLSSVNCQPRILSPKGGGYDNRTAICFDLGQEEAVTIKVYNGAGRLVRVLTEGEMMSVGSNVVYWDGKDKWNHFCTSGLYIVTIESKIITATKTVMVLNK